MVKFHRIGLVVALAALAVLADSNSASAQRRGNNNFGGSNNNNNNNNSNQDNNRRNRNSDNDKNNQADGQKFQNLIQGGGQGGQGGQNNSDKQQFGRNNQQGNQNFQQTFKNQNQNQFQQFKGGANNNNNNKWQAQKYNRHNELQQWVVGFNGGPRPFSNDWYKNHPNAWHHHHDNNNWEVATAVGVMGWLGWQNARSYDNTVYVYDPVPVQTVVVNGQPTVAVDPGNPGDWMTLGSYSLMTGSGDPGTRILQLSIDREGNIRGSYYDMITNNTNNVIGVADKNTQQVRWTLDSNRQLTFVATLDQLTQPQGVVNVKLPGGELQQWQLVRMENATAANQQ
jgi:hypothetical protein